MGSTTNLLPQPIDIDAWMRASDTANPLINLTRVNALLASVIGDLVNQQKSVVEEIAARIKKIGELNARVKRLANPTDSKPDASVTFGTSVADSLDLLNQLKDVGVKNMDGYILAVKFANIPLATNNQFVTNISFELQNISESEQNRSQQESLRLQTMTNRYTQASDQASSVIQKDAQGESTIINNIRGAGG